MTLSGSDVALGGTSPEHLEAGPPTRRGPGLSRRLWRALLAGAAVLAILLVVSLATARGWRPPALEPPLGAMPLPSVAPEDRHLPYAFVDYVETVTDSGVPAQVVRPRGAEGTIPGIVLVAGSGVTTRVDLADEAEALARGGLAVLTYDKRTEGYSPLSRDYARLADDALAALDVVARQPGVDPDRVGLLGFSEGGWVVPLAAEMSATRARVAGRPEPARVAYTVLVSAPVVSPLEQMVWTADRALAAAPDAVRSGAAAAIAMGRPVVGYLGTDVGPALAAGRQPTYAVWGAADLTVPVAVAAERLRAATGDRSRIEVVPGAVHRVAVGTGWAERASDWVRRGYPSDEVVRGVEPGTLVGLPTLPAQSPVGDPRWHLVLAALAAVVAASRPVRPRGPGVRSARSG